MSTSSRCALACPRLRRSSLWFRSGRIRGACAFSVIWTTGWWLRSRGTYFFAIRTFFSSCAPILELWSTRSRTLSAVPRHGSRHVPRVGVSISRSFVTFQGGGHVVSPPPFSSSAHVAATAWPYVVAGVLSSRGTHSHATPPVADERPLVVSGRQSSLPDPPVSGLCRGSQVVAQQGLMEAGGSSSHSAPIPVVIYRLVRVGSTSSRPHSLGGMVKRKSQGHINIREMRAVELALASFLPQLAGQSVVLMSDNTSVVAYLRHQGGTVSCRLCRIASVIALLVERHLIHLQARYVSGKKNILADQLSHPDQILPAEWSLLPRVFGGICREFGQPNLDLFTTWANNKFPHYVSQVPNPVAWKQDALHPPWNHLMAYVFPPFALLRQVISQVMELEGLRSLLVAPLWPQKEWFTDVLDLLVAEPLELPRVWNLPSTASRQEAVTEASRPSDFTLGA